ncbi:MAG: 54S ribosomal protein L2 mitochondrial [Alyxoria varia]|nr:MAG: 54S ribosomal protein L2 mitochondrial [Alyxoria varia]
MFKKVRAPWIATWSPLRPLGCVKSRPCVRDAFDTAQSFTPVRHATHGAQGLANGPKSGPGKRLGAKKTGEQYVIPGNIIFRQRGTKWFPGENVGLGRDHTLYALQPGFVKYYRDPQRHPDRHYIGVAFERNQALPSNPFAPRRRKLGMVASPRNMDEVTTSTTALPSKAGTIVARSASSTTSSTPAKPLFRNEREARRRMAAGRIPQEELLMWPDYSYRESNFAIGRAAERANVKVEEFVPGDRFKAWRKRNERKAKAAEKRAMGRAKKTSKRKGKRLA